MKLERRRRLGVALVVVVATVAAFATPAFAEPIGGGELGPGYVRATAADLGSGTFGAAGLPTSEPGTASPFRWIRIVYDSRCVEFPGTPPFPLNPVPGNSFGWPLNGGPSTVYSPNVAMVSNLSRDPLPPGAVVLGDFVQEVGDDPAVYGDIVVIPRCIGPGDAPPALPPSSAAIWEETPLPRAVVTASPPGTSAWPGVTRLASDFHSPAVAPTTASVDLDGYHVDVVATPIAYGWSFGDGTTVVTTDAVAPTRVQYLRRGDYVVTRYVVWEGHATITAFGGSFGERYLGTVTIPERVPYHVAEVRSLLRTTPGRR